MRLLAGCTVAICWAAFGLTQEPIGAPKVTGKLVSENWQRAYLDGQRSGYVQFTVQEFDHPTQKILRASRKLSLSLLRFGDQANVEATTGTDETPDGKVLGVFMRQGLGHNVDLSVRGVVAGEQLHVVAEGKMKFDKMIPWNPEVVGALGELQLVKKNKPQPGTKFEYIMFEPIINTLVKVQATVERIEDVEFAGRKVPRLLRVTSNPTEVAGITLPGSTFWFDANYDLVKSETIMPGLGRLTLERSTREEALQPCRGPDLGKRQSIPLAKGLTNSRTAAEVTYRIKLQDKDRLAVFARDDRQTVKLLEKDGLELVVQAIRQPPEKDIGGKPPEPEFLQSNNFVSSDDALVKQHAAAAVGSTSDPWQKAQAIERWVYQNMKAMNFTEAMAPANEVARSLTGDCTEYSMLTAAMARAVGIPSRTAMGLVYVDGQNSGGPMLAMHMWTEVWIRGKWIAIDSTLGRGSVGATHIKVTDHSWHEMATMTPLMPIMRVIVSQPTVEIVSEKAVSSGPRTVEVVGEKNGTPSPR